MGVIVALFIVLPIAELAVILQVGNWIGPVWTLALLLLSAAVGAWLLRREGRRSWRAFQLALSEHRAPTREVADGALVIFGAALMVTPGFITDITGMLCLFPPSRAAIRRLLVGTVLRRYFERSGLATARRVRSRRGRSVPPQPPSSPRDRPRVIDGEVEPRPPSP
ncbi:MAG: FxsA family protein [Mycobacteriales bacterium]